MLYDAGVKVNLSCGNGIAQLKNEDKSGINRIARFMGNMLFRKSLMKHNITIYSQS
ncbi:MAG: hypothetical protein JWQ78_1086, partial [Sediminibacterium sp.]|nr:hypothetical protein [Sediminibacterium sp.]